MEKPKWRSPTKKQLPGDIQLDPLDYVLTEGQPLTADEKRLVDRAYSLFGQFKDKLREVHDEMQDARKMRELRQDERSLTSAPLNTLNSCIDNVIADQIDNMPEAKLVPERAETMQSAEEMSDIVSYCLYQANWPKKYQTLMEDAVVTGTGVAQVFWDEDMERGDGMVNVLAWHPEDFYPDPMFENLQDGRGCFKVTHTTVAWVEEHYPHVKGYVKSDEHSNEGVESEFEAPSGDKKTTFIEFWYKHYDAEKRKNRVHMAQFAGKALLYSTELGFGGADKEDHKQGVFAHGELPFVLFKYKDVWRKPFGVGLVHDYKPTQNAIDRHQKYIDDNARQSSIQKTYVRKNSAPVEDIADMTKTVIEYEGNDIRTEMTTVQAAPLNGQVFQNMNYLIDTMKQDCGQNQFSRGEGGLGVTAATAIQALQEAGGKITRMHTEKFKNAFREMVEQIMWLMSEYISPERQFKIVGGWDSTGNMEDRLVKLTPAKPEGDKLPKPAYTVRVQVQKNNPLQIQADNEFVMQAAQVCAQAGTPLPPETVISLMEGYRTKSSVLKAVRANSQIQQQMQQMQAQIQQLTAQLEQQKKANAGYLKALSTPGGGAAQQEQAQNKADYTAFEQATGEEKPEV